MRLGPLTLALALASASAAWAQGAPSVTQTSRALGLSPTLQHALSDYAQTLARLRAGGNDRTVAHAARLALVLPARLVRELAPRVEAAEGQPREAIARQLASLTASLPGIHVMGAEPGAEVGFGVFTDLAALSHVAGMPSFDAQLLQTAGPLLAESTGFPIYIEQQTDEAGCFSPASARPTLTRLSVLWPHARGAVKTVLRVPLATAIDTLSRDVNFCAPAATARAEAMDAATILRRLPDLGGKQAANRLIAGAHSSRAKFNFVGG